MSDEARYNPREPVMPVAQVRALVRLLYPDHMTPIAKRQIESACAAAEATDG